MKVYPITTFSQIQVRKQSSQISSANNNQYSKINFQNSTSFKSKVDYRQYYKAIDILYDMGINGENLFLNKKIHKYLPSDAEVFEANFLKLKKAYDNLKDILNDNEVIKKFLHSTAPNFDKFLQMASLLKKSNIYEGYIENLFTFIEQESKSSGNWDQGLDKVVKLLNLKKCCMEHVELLNQFNRRASSFDVDTLIFSYPLATSNTFEILGEKGFVYSLNEKSDNVNRYIALLGLVNWKDDIRENLIEMTNPTESRKYKNLKSALKNLKSKYDPNLPLEELKSLQNEINTVSFDIKNLLKNSIKDPKDIFERSLIISSVYSNSGNANHLLELLNPKTKEELDRLHTAYMDEIVNFYDLKEIPNAENILKEIGFQDNKYLATFFKAKQGFKTHFKEMIKLLSENPEKSPLEIYEMLENNKKTRLILESYGVNYDNYISYNPNIEVTGIKNFFGEDTSIKIRKVDMNNIIKSLTLGNEASCCAKIGGSKDNTIIPYSRNKMISAIEVLNNDVSVGNTMCYLGLVDDKLAFILDNVEIINEFSNQESIREALFKCARKITEDINCPNIPIYIAGQRNKIMTNDLPTRIYDLKILGETGDDLLYLDFLSKGEKISKNKRYIATLNDVTYIADGTEKPVFESQIRVFDPDGVNSYYMMLNEL